MGFMGPDERLKSSFKNTRSQDVFTRERSSQTMLDDAEQDYQRARKMKVDAGASAVDLYWFDKNFARRRETLADEAATQHRYAEKRRREAQSITDQANQRAYAASPAGQAAAARQTAIDELQPDATDNYIQSMKRKTFRSGGY